MKLTPAQWRLLDELAEPNSNFGNCWYFPAKNLRTLRALASLGLAQAGEWDNHRYGFWITAKGREARASRKGSTHA